LIERGCNDDNQEMGGSRALGTILETAAADDDDDKLKGKVEATKSPWKKQLCSEYLNRKL
jgi:hypothetical protein